MLYRVALQGFAEPDRRALASFIHDLGRREPAYELVPRCEDADVLLADGDSAEVVADVADESRGATTLFLSEHRPPGSAWHVPRPIQPDALLHGLDDVVTHLDGAPPAGVAWKTHDTHALAKANARRAARRARRAVAMEAGAATLAADVLVLAVDDDDRNHLCGLLEHFGFCTYPARDAQQALWLLQARTFRAVFLELDFEERSPDSGIDLCRRVTGGMRFGADAASALFIVSDGARSADRVRATLAGSNGFLVKPLGRGDVAGALEGCGINMPRDERCG